MAETEAAPVKEMCDLTLDTSSNGDAPAPANGESSPTPSSGCNFKDNFKAFSKFGDLKSDGKMITLSQSDKWMKQAKVIDGKKITTTDTGIYFKKLKSQKVGIEDYKKFLDDLAKNKKVEVEEIKNKMINCGPPGHHGLGGRLSAGAKGAAHLAPGKDRPSAMTDPAKKVVKSPAAVERLTDTSKYTGSHKQRFDETGKGKGIAGRKDLSEASGYVTGYQHKNTYDKTH